MSNNTLRSFPWIYETPNEWYRLTDWDGYYHYSIMPILFTFPSKLYIRGGNSGNIIEGINAAFNDLGQSGWSSNSISIEDVLPDSALDYRFTVCVLASNANNSTIVKWYVTDSQTLRERLNNRDYGEVDINLNLKTAGITQGMKAQLIYFLSYNNIPQGAHSLTSNDCTSLEYLPNADRKTYTVEYISPTYGLHATIDFDLNSYTGTYFYVKRVHIKITKDSNYVESTYFLDIQAELASVDWIWLKQNLKPSFTNNVYEQTWTTSQLPEDNKFVMSSPDRDSFSCVLRFNDPQNGYTEILASEYKDVNN